MFIHISYKKLVDIDGQHLSMESFLKAPIYYGTNANDCLENGVND